MEQIKSDVYRNKRNSSQSLNDQSFFFFKHNRCLHHKLRWKNRASREEWTVNSPIKQLWFTPLASLEVGYSFGLKDGIEITFHNFCTLIKILFYNILLVIVRLRRINLVWNLKDGKSNVPLTVHISETFLTFTWIKDDRFIFTSSTFALTLKLGPRSDVFFFALRTKNSLYPLGNWMDTGWLWYQCRLQQGASISGTSIWGATVAQIVYSTHV